eukprot:1183593-Prorocentrum_minimum.AAC.4
MRLEWARLAEGCGADGPTLLTVAARAQQPNRASLDRHPQDGHANSHADSNGLLEAETSLLLKMPDAHPWDAWIGAPDAPGDDRSP